MKSYPINVLYVDENQDGTTGGSHYCLLDLVRELDKEKYNSIVMFYEKNHALREFKETGIEVIIYPKPLGVNFIKEFKKRYENNPSLFVKLIQKLYNIINVDIFPTLYFIFFIIKKKIDIIHINNSVFAGFDWVIASKITFTKCIAHQRGYYYEIPQYCRFHSKRYDYIFGVSEATKQNMLNLGIPLRNYSTFYDRINIYEFKSKLSKSKHEIKDEFGVKEDQPFIGIIGNIQRWKGQRTVVDSVGLLNHKYPTIKCLLVGDISSNIKDDIKYYNELKSEVNENNLDDNIILTGYRSDVADIINALDIFIHASTRPEPYGLVVLEAMALGKALIASSEGGPAEMVVDGESGFLVPPGNPEILSEKLDILLSDSAYKEEMGKNAFKRIKRKFSKLNIRQVEDVYEQLLQ